MIEQSKNRFLVHVSSSRPRPSSPSEVLAMETIFGPPPILPGEDASAYEALVRHVTADVKPADIIEKRCGFETLSTSPGKFSAGAE
jgi:hypothetical protein